MDRQVDAVLRMLGDSPEGITAMDALREVGTFRLAARIADLRGRGSQGSRLPGVHGGPGSDRKGTG
jgi:hypothetical protein